MTEPCKTCSEASGLGLRKVISGGQTGADIAGLRAAKAAGISTGGWMSNDFRTLDGPRPEYEKEFGIRSHVSYAYPIRTRMNVRDSDATMRFAIDFHSAGEECTWASIVRLRKLHFDVEISAEELTKPEMLTKVWLRSPDAAADWIIKHRIYVLNIAGNSETTAPGIGEFVEKYLALMFEILRVRKWVVKK